MFSSKEKKQVIKSTFVDTESQIPTTLAEGMTSKDGKLYGSSSVKISGAFFGDVDIEGALVVTGSGSVHGNVKAEDAKVYGKIEGNVLVAGRVHIHPSGSLVGDITCACLVVDEGAVFHGRSNVTSEAISFSVEEANSGISTTHEPVQ